jgi:hypothetical protein
MQAFPMPDSRALDAAMTLLRHRGAAGASLVRNQQVSPSEPLPVYGVPGGQNIFLRKSEVLDTVFLVGELQPRFRWLGAARGRTASEGFSRNPGGELKAGNFFLFLRAQPIDKPRFREIKRNK